MVLRTAEEEPGVENRLVLCSGKDRYVLTQDICVMCGSLGMDQEGCLISCAQCGQCYHPYCVNVKVLTICGILYFIFKDFKKIKNNFTNTC